jgi:hypothetical protein
VSAPSVRDLIDEFPGMSTHDLHVLTRAIADELESRTARHAVNLAASKKGGAK